jgi:hypothetical protein
MSEWMDIARWQECAGMARPGIVFEVRNAAGQVMLTPCVQPLPIPFDWTTPPVAFRAVPELPAVRSDPVPPPRR